MNRSWLSISALAMSTDASIPPTFASAPCRLVLYCCRRRHNSLYRRNNLGYSPSNACFRKDEARESESKKEAKRTGLANIKQPDTAPIFLLYLFLHFFCLYSLFALDITSLQCWECKTQMEGRKLFSAAEAV